MTVETGTATRKGNAGTGSVAVPRRERALVIAEIAELKAMIQTLALETNQKEYLEKRWLHHIALVQEHFQYNQDWHYRLRAIIITGGVLIPLLSALNLSGTLAPAPMIATAILGAVVAGCAAWEGVKNYGGVWQEKWRTIQILLGEGWQFFELAGDKYQKATDHKTAFPIFVESVETFIREEIGVYLAAISPRAPGTGGDNGKTGEQPPKPE